MTNHAVAPATDPLEAIMLANREVYTELKDALRRAPEEVRVMFTNGDCRQRHRATDWLHECGLLELEPSRVNNCLPHRFEW